MRIKKTEQQHIDGLRDKWPLAVAAASLCIRQNSKLVGLDKIRDDLVISAALYATGAPTHPGGFVIPKGAGQPSQEMQDIVDAAFAQAAEAVVSALPRQEKHDAPKRKPPPIVRPYPTG